MSKAEAANNRPFTISNLVKEHYLEIVFLLFSHRDKGQDK